MNPALNYDQYEVIQFLARHPFLMLAVGAIFLALIVFGLLQKYRNTQLRHKYSTRPKRGSINPDSRNNQNDNLSHLFYKLAATSRDGIIIVDDRELITFSNKAATVILGYQSGELAGANLHEIVVPEEHTEKAHSGFQTFIDSGKGRVLDDTLEVQAKRKDGKSITVELTVNSLQENNRRYAIGIFRDVSDRLKILQRLRETQDNFRNIVEKNQTGIILINGEGVIQFANNAAAKMIKRESSDLKGINFGVPASTDVRSDMSIIRSDGKIGVAETMFTRTEWQNELAYLVMMHDITPYREAQAQINELAFKDSITGLPNRNRLLTELERTVKRMGRSGKVFAILFLDLDRFKDVNDTLGHEIGDKLLQQVGMRLLESVRSSDLVARMGGDEFVIILENITGGEDVQEVAQKILINVKKPFNIGANELFIDTSIGSSLYPLNSQSSGEMLKQADTAMYRAKSDGTGFAFYTPDLSDMVERSARLDRDLRHAIEMRQFEMYYQRQFDLANLEPISYESLIRWNHPREGLVLPRDFIPQLEKSGLINPVGDWVIESVIKQLRDWIDAKNIKVTPVAVNLSPVQLENEGLADKIESLLDQYDVPPHLLVIEITESAMLMDVSSIMPRLNALIALGLHLYMDDFGTGYSSLSLLKKLPFNIIKIDQSFVKDLAFGSSDKALVAATITMAHGLGKKVMAEGVETEEQLEILSQLGCDYAQGFYFAKPLPGSKVD